MLMKSGIVILNKDVGISSNTAVNKVKHVIGAKKAGHLGTLDVLGEGVLPITLNKATRLFDYFLKKDKIYRAVFVFGFETSTLDCEGEITNINYKLITSTEIEKVLQKFQGKIKQVPPQFSALKVKGKTAYDLARKGERVELAEREVEIYDFKFFKEIGKDKKEELKKRFFQFHNIDLLENNEIKNSFKNNIFEFEIVCSSGTYIRSLCRDLANELTTYGTMLCIVRTRSGIFKLEQAKSLEEIKEGNFTIIDIEDAIDLPSIYIDKEKGKKLLDGKKVEHLPIQNSSFKLYLEKDFLGIANNKNKGILKMEVFLKE